MSLSFGLLSHFHSDSGWEASCSSKILPPQITSESNYGGKNNTRNRVVPRECFSCEGHWKSGDDLISSSSLSLPCLKGVCLCLWASLHSQVWPTHTCNTVVTISSVCLSLAADFPWSLAYLEDLGACASLTPKKTYFLHAVLCRYGPPTLPSKEQLIFFT